MPAWDIACLATVRLCAAAVLLLLCNIYHAGARACDISKESYIVIINQHTSTVSAVITTEPHPSRLQWEQKAAGQLFERLSTGQTAASSKCLLLWAISWALADCLYCVFRNTARMALNTAKTGADSSVGQSIQWLTPGCMGSYGRLSGADNAANIQLFSSGASARGLGHKWKLCCHHVHRDRRQ